MSKKSASKQPAPKKKKDLTAGTKLFLAVVATSDSYSAPVYTKMFGTESEAKKFVETTFAEGLVHTEFPPKGYAGYIEFYDASGELIKVKEYKIPSKPAPVWSER